jgi:hypothetical protein
VHARIHTDHRVLDLSGAAVTTEALAELGRLAAEEAAFRVRMNESLKQKMVNAPYSNFDTLPPIHPHRQSVRVLGFFDNGLGPGGATALAEALERGGFRDTLEGLYVRANQVETDVDRKGIQQCLRPLILLLQPANANKIDDDGGTAQTIEEVVQEPVPALFRALRTGACQAPLLSLSLAQNGLGFRAAYHLGRALASPYLKQLKASGSGG